jgi:MFS family permease
VGNAHQAQLPEFAEGFSQDDSGLAYTLLLLAGATGAIVGGLLLELLPRAHPTPRRALRLAALWTMTMLVFAASPVYSLGLATLFLSGVFLIGFTSMAQALVQLEAPMEMRGRMIGLFNTSLNGLRVGSGVTVGFVGAVIGIHWSLGISAALLLVLLAGLAAWIPRRSPMAAPARQAAPALAEESVGQTTGSSG